MPAITPSLNDILNLDPNVWASIDNTFGNLPPVLESAIDAMSKKMAENIAMETQYHFRAIEASARRNHVIQGQELLVVKHAITALGKDAVHQVSFAHRWMAFGPDRTDDYISKLKDLMADLYLKDNSKRYLRQYVDDKFGADLGL